MGAPSSGHMRNLLARPSFQTFLSAILAPSVTLGLDSVCLAKVSRHLYQGLLPVGHLLFLGLRNHVRVEDPLQVHPGPWALREGSKESIKGEEKMATGPRRGERWCPRVEF